MTWLKLDDSFAEHPKVIELSDGAFRLHVSVMCYCARNPTDGIISTSALKAHFPRFRRFMVELLRRGLWEEAADGYAIHDFLEYNPSAARKKATSEARAEAGRLGGQRSGEIRAKPKQTDEAKPKQFASRLLEPRPVPSRPVPTSSLHELENDSTVVSSSDDAERPGVREMRDAALSRLPAKFRFDALTFDEMTSFARDFEGQWEDLAAATDECRRHNELCFPGNLRKYMPVQADDGAGSTPDMLGPFAHLANRRTS